jgi:hypothetical protein
LPMSGNVLKVDDLQGRTNSACAYSWAYLTYIYLGSFKFSGHRGRLQFSCFNLAHNFTAVHDFEFSLQNPLVRSTEISFTDLKNQTSLKIGLQVPFGACACEGQECICDGVVFLNSFRFEFLQSLSVQYVVYYYY